MGDWGKMTLITVPYLELGCCLGEESLPGVALGSTSSSEKSKTNALQTQTQSSLSPAPVVSWDMLSLVPVQLTMLPV